MCNRLSTSGRAALLAAVASLPGISASQAQTPLGKKGGSDNVELVAHLPLSGYFTVAGVDIEQELARPYVYVSGFAEYAGFTVISVKEPHDPKVVYEWKFPGRENRVGRPRVSVQALRRPDLVGDDPDRGAICTDFRCGQAAERAGL